MMYTLRVFTLSLHAYIRTCGVLLPHVRVTVTGLVAFTTRDFALRVVFCRILCVTFTPPYRCLRFTFTHLHGRRIDVAEVYVTARTLPRCTGILSLPVRCVYAFFNVCLHTRFAFLHAFTLVRRLRLRAFTRLHFARLR